MTGNDEKLGVEAELVAGLDALERALRVAGEATLSVRALLPRIASVGTFFDEIEATVRAGRAQLAGTPMNNGVVYMRPTLVASQAETHIEAPSITFIDAEASVISPDQEWQDAAAGIGTLDPSFEGAIAQADAADDAELAALRAFPLPAGGTGVTSFRLEFHSRPGPLDLRVVDEAVGEHPAVRDVALLDYDGRAATLKVWIDGTARAADVRQSLLARASQIFASGSEVSIVAIEDAA